MIMVLVGWDRRLSCRLRVQEYAKFAFAVMFTVVAGLSLPGCSEALAIDANVTHEQWCKLERCTQLNWKTVYNFLADPTQRPDHTDTCNHG